jgi:hypothetical protein
MLDIINQHINKKSPPGTKLDGDVFFQNGKAEFSNQQGSRVLDRSQRSIARKSQRGDILVETANKRPTKPQQGDIRWPSVTPLRLAYPSDGFFTDMPLRWGGWAMHPDYMLSRNSSP